jgi:carboxypeptidase C (cathepsin A)
MKNALIALVLTLSAFSLFAQSPEAAPSRQPAPAGARRETPSSPDSDDRAEGARQGDEKREARPPADARDKISTTQHAVTIGGQTISYTARAGTMIMRDEEGKPRASFFFTS